MIDEHETLKAVLVCGTIGRIKDLIHKYESEGKDAFVVFEDIQKTLDYANETYRKVANNKEA